jgi:hypothetical protein
MFVMYVTSEEKLGPDEHKQWRRDPQKNVLHSQYHHEIVASANLSYYSKC